jgi:hypothetical protein
MKETEVTKAIGRGVALAASVMVQRGEPGFAKEILEAGGIASFSKLRTCEVCDYDMTRCLEAIRIG